MIITVETMARPCPGVDRAIALAEEILGKGQVLYSVGQLIHNRREIERLQRMGLRHMKPDILANLKNREKFANAHFLVRTHGESAEIIQKVEEQELSIVDATCPIVHHSHDLVDQHTREGWRIIIAGNKMHPEVISLLARTRGNGVVVSSEKDALKNDSENRSLLIAQSTIHPDLFSKIRKILSGKLPGLKIVDTTCRFIRNRQNDVASFGMLHDVVIIVGGKNSSNCRLLYSTSLKVNPRSYMVEAPSEVENAWFGTNDRIGITGGASTPRWQLEEMKSYLNNHQSEENPQGLKNRKGGKFLCWMRKNKNKTA